MLGLLKACESLSKKLLVIAIKAIKHLSTSPQLIEVLQNSNAMEILVGILGKNIKSSHANVSQRNRRFQASQLTFTARKFVRTYSKRYTV